MTTVNHLKIVVSTSQGDWETSFLKTTLVKDVLQSVKDHFGYAETGTYRLTWLGISKVILDDQRTLESYNIENNSKLLFTDLGGGVACR